MMLPSRVTLGAATLAALGFAALPSARAEFAYGLTTSSQLFTFDTGAPQTITAPVAITGVAANQTIVGMDIRPATGALFILGYDLNATTGANAQLYALSPTGAATASGAAFALSGNYTTGGGPIASSAYGVPGGRNGFDFNPVPDRIRLIIGDSRPAGNDANFRLNPNNGALAATDQPVAYAAGDVNQATDPTISGAAYANNVAGATTTTLYAYDFRVDTLVRVAVAAGMTTDGQLTTIGLSGVTFDDAGMDMDISGATGTAYLNGRVGGAENFYTINLGTGAATLVGQFGVGAGVDVLDIAVAAVPEPSTWALLTVSGLALVGMAARRRAAIR